MVDDPSNRIFLIVPEFGPQGVEQPIVMEEEGAQQQGIRNFVQRVLVTRKEVAIDADKVKCQIEKYVSIVRDIANDARDASAALKLDEMTLSLTLSAEGNIGIASTSAEAGIELKFKRPSTGSTT